jgi:type I restriction enzyme, S subunit
MAANWNTDQIGSFLKKTETRDPSRKPDSDFFYVDVSSVDNALYIIVNASLLKGADAPSRARKVIRAGDVIYATVRPTLKRVAYVGPQFDDQICSTGFCVLRTNGALCSAFLYYWLLTDEITKRVEGIQRGASYPAIRDSDVKKLPVPIPPHSEQRRIAAVLTAVQRAVEQQQRLIALTAELKKALMHKLFSEGTRDEAQKQTEFRRIPRSWTIARLGDCCTIQTGIAKGRKVPPQEAVTLPYLRVANVQDGYLDLSEMKEITIRRSEVPRYSLRDGDLLLTEGGDLDKLGRGFIWHGQFEKCVHQNHIFVVRSDLGRISAEFLAYQVQSDYGKAYFLSVAHKTTNLACINTTKLKGLPVLIPTPDEQCSIVNALRQIDGKLRAHRERNELLGSLFRTLLHQLMTAELRVDAVDLSELKALGIEVE